MYFFPLKLANTSPLMVHAFLNLNTDLASSYSLRRLFVRDSVMENLAPLINFKFFFVKKPDFK